MKTYKSWAATATAILLAVTAASKGQVTDPAAMPKADAATLTARKFVDRLAKQDFEGAARMGDATMQQAAPAPRLREIWASLTRGAGRYEKEISMRKEEIQQYVAVILTCQFQKQRIGLRVVVDKASKIAGFFLVPPQAAESGPPAYAKPALFREKEVVIGAGEWKLPGTLSLPTGKGPFPAAVLVHGSGPEDRDESIGPNKPFRDLAWGLASQGIAVLRYEKRTKQYAATLAVSIAGLTVKEETIADALAAVSLLRKTEGIDTNRIFVLGHSLGGMLAPRMGAADPGLAGLIILAAAARPLEDLMLEQVSYQTSLAGDPSADAKAKVVAVKEQVAAIKKLSANNSPKGLLLGAPAGYWLDLKGFNPPESAKTLKQPMLILQGEKDCQVNSKVDFEAWRQALSGRKNATLKSYPTLNHLFMEVDGKSTGAEYELAGHVAGSVVTDIAAWIKPATSKDF